MITNFETQTAPLNEKELEAANIIGHFLMKSHVGKNKVVTAKQIGEGMAKTYERFRIIDKNGDIKPYLTGERIRKIIFYLRTNDIVPLLLGTSNGYYVADKSNPIEIRDCIRSLKERVAAQYMSINSLERQLKKELAGHPAAEIDITV